MGVEYRIQAQDFARARVAEKLRQRHFIVRETSAGIAVWETEPAAGMPSVEIQTAGGDAVTLLLSAGSPEFRERVIGVVLTSLAAVNDQVVFSEL